GLMSRGLVQEVGYGPSTGGKPPMLLSIAKQDRNLVGVDLSRSDFRGAILDLRGNIRHREQRPLQQRNRKAALALVYELLDAVMTAADRPVIGIGVCAPGLIDAVNGVIVQAVNLDWRDIRLRDLLEARYDVPVYVANDCQAAALGEYTFGNSEGIQDLVVISVEWGIGSGIILGGELFHGNPLGAGEIGHVSVVENGRLCTCGNRGCLETVATQAAIVRRTRELLQETQAEAGLGDEGNSGFQTVCAMAHQGHPAANQAVREAARGLGIVAANLAVILGGCHIRLTGQLNCLGEPFLNAIREEMTGRALTALSGATEISFATLGNDIMLSGAAALLLTQELGVY
ncbi:MAG: ROK family protein, partial [Anaerolineae bacterium]|nr:ROK family protein [Anaerolineae bacterium]